MSGRTKLFFTFFTPLALTFFYHSAAADQPLAKEHSGVIEWHPLIIDKTKDGKVSDTEKASVYFDVMSAKFRNATSWMNPGDAFLVFDKNMNGDVDNGSEITGEGQMLTDISSLDDNKDGKVDDKDNSFDKLKVWADMNMDGIAQRNELQKLSGSIDKSSDGGYVLNAGSEFFRLKSALLRADKVNTTVSPTVPFDIAVATMPQQRGYGKVPDLWTAMSAKPELLKLAQELSSTPFEKVFLDFPTYLSRFDQLLYIWTGVQNIDPNSRGVYVDARQLAFIEVTLAEDFKGIKGSIPSASSSLDLKKIYEGMKAVILTHFLIQSGGSRIFQDPVAYDPLKDVLFFSGAGTAPSLSVEAIKNLAKEGEAAKDKLAYWASVLFYINQVRGSLDNIGANELAALDAAIKAVSSKSSFELFSKNYQEIVPCPFCLAKPPLANSTAIKEDKPVDSNNGASVPVNPALAAIQRPLLQAIVSSNTKFEEQYISWVLMPIRNSGRVKDKLDQQDLEALKQRRELEQRHRRVQLYIGFDRDFDGRVARAEIEATITEQARNAQNKNAFGGRVDELMKADTNGDGVIDMQEMSTLIQDGRTQTFMVRGVGYGQFDPETLLGLDPNGDGVLTVAELEQLARKAFHTVDTDGDGMLSDQEQMAVVRAIEKR